LIVFQLLINKIYKPPQIPHSIKIGKAETEGFEFLNKIFMLILFQSGNAGFQDRFQGEKIKCHLKN